MRWRHLTLGLPFLLAGCVVGLDSGVPGNGTIASDDRDLPEFHAIEIHGAIEATVTLGERSPVTLRGDENLLPLIKTEVKDGRLVVTVDSREGIRPTERIKLTARTPALDAAEAHGATRLTVKAGAADHFTAKATGASTVAVGGVTAPDLEAESLGASTLTIDGTATKAKVDVAGASTARLGGLRAEEVAVHVSGASNAQVHATRQVAGSVSGASSVRVAGEPAKVDVQTSGASSVKREGPKGSD